MSTTSQRQPRSTRTRRLRTGAMLLGTRSRKHAEITAEGPRFISVMGPANRAPGVPIMGASGRSSNPVMGGPDAASQLSVMGAGDRGAPIGLFGHSDPRFVDSLFGSRSR